MERHEGQQQTPQTPQMVVEFPIISLWPKSQLGGSSHSSSTLPFDAVEAGEAMPAVPAVPAVEAGGAMPAVPAVPAVAV